MTRGNITYVKIWFWNIFQNYVHLKLCNVWFRFQNQILVFCWAILADSWNWWCKYSTTLRHNSCQNMFWKIDYNYITSKYHVLSCFWSEKRLIRLTFWDTLWEQFCLCDQSALIDVRLSEGNPFKARANPRARCQKISRANLYENEMV